MSPRPGIWSRLVVVSSLKRPPMTTVWPFSTMMLVISSCVVSLGMTKPSRLTTLPSLIDGRSSRRTVPSLLTKGRTVSWVPTSRNSTVWLVLVSVCVVER